jgi:hypothetical protein
MFIETRTAAGDSRGRQRETEGLAMLCNGDDKVLDLAHGDLVELADARGTTLRVTKGTLWITQERDRRDIVLAAGDVWTVEQHGLTLVEAQGAATVCLVGTAAEFAHSRSRRLRLSTRIKALLASYLDGHLEERRLPYY